MKKTCLFYLEACILFLSVTIIMTVQKRGKVLMFLFLFCFFLNLLHQMQTTNPLKQTYTQDTMETGKTKMKKDLTLANSNVT